MKILIYVNKEKDIDGVWLNNTKQILEEAKLDYSIITAEDFDKKFSADALLVLGGDGTILALNDFSNKNGIPIVGINAGKLGFLTEFEKFQTKEVVELVKSCSLTKEPRLNLCIDVLGKTYNALNDVVVQRMYNGDKGLVISLEVEIDGNKVDKLTGDGLIICTPTGSTAYSLSAGGAILAPGINAFSFTPISAHSLSQRPIIFSADHTCKITLLAGEKAGVFVDGKLVENLRAGQSINIQKSKNTTVFLRREESNFFNMLTRKLMDGRQE